VSPNYRLLPESNGAEILSDVKDLLTWTENRLPAILKAQNIQIDTSKLLVAGESGGGYLSIQSGFARPDLVKAIVATYPMLDFDPAVYTHEGRKPILGSPEFPASVVTDHIESMPKGANGKPIPVSHNDPPRLQLCFASAQQGRIPEFLGDDPMLRPLERLEKEKLDPILLIAHGEDDSAVPISGSYKFLEKIGKLQPDARVTLKTQKGEHGFDAETTLDDAWLRDSLEPITKAWLK
jgi:acetyl esterase/lipase